MNEVLIIPARYNSSRFPGKALYKIMDKTLIYRVWLKCIEAIFPEMVYIATDDDRIKKHCEENNMQYIMTSKNCLTGTDRVAEAYKKLNKKYETIVNVQGDEPLIDPQDILQVVKGHKRFPDSICCGMCRIKSESEFRNPNIIKIVMNKTNELLYASRAAMPTDKKLRFIEAHKQVCIYAFSPEALDDFSSHRKTTLEEIEDIEFLRFLEIGYKVKMVKVSENSIPVDVPIDIRKVEKAIKEANNE